jgi:predicted RNA binding protein YcfA (HicA-like mRNA interferase family)
MADYTKDIIRIFMKNGCVLIPKRGKGDHSIWRCPNAIRPITVDSAVESRHLANEIMKQAGINYKFR